MLRMGLGAVAVLVGSWGIVWFTRALKESGRWFTIKGLFRFGPDWWEKVFVESPGHHAYFQYAVPYLLFFGLALGGAALLRSGYRSYQGGRM